MSENKNIFYKLGQLVGEITAGIVSLCLGALIMWCCWNFVLVDATPLNEINYWETILLFFGFRAITYKRNK